MYCHDICNNKKVKIGKTYAMVEGVMCRQKMILLIVLLCLCLSSKVISSETVEISPSPQAAVQENHPLKITCSFSGKVAIIDWLINNRVIVSLSRGENGNCVPFSGNVDEAVYQYSCNSEYSLTIMQVTENQHEKKLVCRFNTGMDFHSSLETNIYVQVPVKSVTFSSPPEGFVYAAENIRQQFICVTTKERPRSTIRWFIRGRDDSIGTGTVVPKNKDLLSVTTGTLSYKFSRNDNATELYCTAFNNGSRNPVQSNESKWIIVQYGTNGGPIIVGFSNGSTLYAINSTEQTLTCYVTDGSPPPTLSWDCFSGNVTDTQNNQTEVRQNFTWTPTVGHSKQTCSCTSEQAVSGLQVFTISVDVLYPPSEPVFKINGRSVSGTISVVQNRNVVVKCESLGNPSPSYEWTNKITSNTATDQYLRLGDKEQSDEGNYTCTASNSMTPSSGNPQAGNNSASFLLDILYPPETPKFRVEQHPLSANLAIVIGDNVSVTCESASDPGPPFIQWQGHPFGIKVLTTFGIQSNTTKKCMAYNTMNPTVGTSEDGLAESEFYITVMSGPTVPRLEYYSTLNRFIQLNVSKLVVVKRTNFSIRCIGSNSVPGPPSYSWTGNKASDSYILSFSDIGEQDQGGKYTCHVNNTMVRTVGNITKGRNSKSVEIEIQHPPDIKPFHDEEIIENKQLSLTCIASGVPPPTDYTWTRTKDNFSQASSTLNITHAKRNDTDTYTCTVRNQMTPTVAEGDTDGFDHKTVNVKILYHPDVTVSYINSTNVTEGDTNVMFLCTADGEPRNFSFSRWKHYAPDGSTILQEYTSYKTAYNEANILLRNASYMDSGTYECSVWNGIRNYRSGELVAKNKIAQVVRGRPVILEWDDTVFSASNQNVSISVTYYSNDGVDPIVKWYRMDNITDRRQEIENYDNYDKKLFYENHAAEVMVPFYNATIKQHGNKTNLVIQNVNESDFGIYELEISNSVNKAVRRVSLVAKGKPDPPSMFRIVKGSVTSSSVALSWLSGFANGANQTFYIQYKTLSFAWRDKVSVEGGERKNQVFNVTVDQLSEETEYFFRINAENEHGESSFAAEILQLSTTAADETATPGDVSFIGAAVGGGIGGAVVISGTVVLLIFLKRRKTKSHSAESPSKTLLKDKERQARTRGTDDTPEINLNPMYESAGPLPSTSNNSDAYSHVDKNRKKTEPVAEIYSQVNKPKKQHNSGCSEVKNDVYSQVQKKVHKEKNAGIVKHKKQKPDKKTKKGMQTEGDLYDNVDTVNSTVAKGDTVYENPSCNIEDEYPRQMRNQDGLIYADLDLPKKPVGKDRKAVIHGLDDRTDYVDIKFGEVGEQAPESDEENTNKDN